MNIFSSETKNTSHPSLFLSKRELATAITGSIGFFIGRAVVFQIVNPLALAFAATFMDVGAGWSFYITAIFVALGLVTRLGDIFVLRYILALGLLCLCHYFSVRILFPYLHKTARSKGKARPYSKGAHYPIRSTLYAQAIMAGLCVLIAGLIAAVFTGGSGYLLAVAIMESILTASLVLTIKRATLILTAHRRKNIISGEDIVALALVLGSVIAGASDIYVGGMSLRFFLCLYVLFVVAHKGGSAMGGTAGMLLGFMLYMVGFWDTGMGLVLGLAGMGGGFMKKFGRLAVMAVVVITGAGAMFLLAPHLLYFTLIYAVIAAGIAFIITPQDFHFNVVSAVNPSMDSAVEYIEKIKEETIQRLGAFASSFEKLASTFSGLSVPVKTSLNKKDASQLIEDVAARACHSCERKNECWEESFYGTYSHVFTLLGICGRKGSVSLEEKDGDTDEKFFEVCLQPKAFIHHLNMVFALYKQNLLWHNRIAESRELVSQQLQGVAGIMHRLAGEIDVTLRFHEGLEEEMIAALLRSKVEVDSVLVLEDKFGRYHVTVNQPMCKNNSLKRACTRIILPTLSSVLKRKMQIESEVCHNSISKDDNKKGCTLRFVEDRKYRIHCGAAHRAKGGHGDSGDSYSYMELKNGQCILALADGMGSGTQARRESAATVELLEEFLESGFEKELAIKMINSVLVLKSNEESFSTLDICAIDLYTGEGEFIKIGAWSSFLLRDQTVTIIPSSSLPMGMLKQVDLEITRQKLLHDDIILMVTDGVTEAVKGEMDKEGWLVEHLKRCGTRTPQEVADYILKAAEKQSGGLPKDDMTILVARIWTAGR
ncbi:MAG: stage II sporulation protein E [Defluviitaleaceae bacterium]|nr:stage II sporulation protein E [Defluviitaleaceae bacterium]